VVASANFAVTEFRHERLKLGEGGPGGPPFSQH
jgi:hypothetical protein